MAIIFSIYTCLNSISFHNPQTKVYHSGKMFCMWVTMMMMGDKLVAFFFNTMLVSCGSTLLLLLLYKIYHYHYHPFFRSCWRTMYEHVFAWFVCIITNYGVSYTTNALSDTKYIVYVTFMSTLLIVWQNVTK